MLSQSLDRAQDHGDGNSAAILAFPVPASDTGLVAALRSDHPQARRTLCERHSGTLLRLACRILGPDPGIRPIVVETLRWAVTHLDALDDSRLLSVWLSSRLVVLAQRRLRLKRALRCLSDWGGARWFDGVHASEQLASTYRALDHLNVGLRLAFCLIVIDSMRWVEAAALLDLPSKVVKARLVSAHASFRNQAERSFPQLMRWHSSPARLGAELANEQDRMVAEIEIYDWEISRDKSTRGFPSFSIVLVSLCVFAIACSVAMRFWGNVPQHSDSSVLGRWIAAPPEQWTSVSFSNGSKITLAPGSRMRVLQSNDFGDASVIESGSAKLTAGSANEQKAVVAAGPFLVSLSQGETELSWTAKNETLEISVRRGTVTLSGCQFGSGSSIEPGQPVRTRCLARGSL